MALFTDGPISTIQDLQNYESGILNVASLESIDLSAKIALAQQEIGTATLLFVLGQSGRDPNYLTRRTLGIPDVVATPQLQNWHALKTLALAYRDAYFNQLNDRYQAKWKQYATLDMQAADSFFNVGVGLVADPMAKPAAPQLGMVPGGAPAGSYYVRITWVNVEGAEGAPSDPNSVTTTGGLTMVVAPDLAPANAAGWNVYAGFAPDRVTLQNAIPISVTSNWTLPDAGLLIGTPSGAGQAVETYLPNDRLILRG